MLGNYGFILAKGTRKGDYPIFQIAGWCDGRDAGTLRNGQSDGPVFLGRGVPVQHHNLSVSI